MLLLGTLGCLLAAQASFSATMPVPAPPCSAPEYRQFDFWLGNWEVRDPKGGFAGTNLVERRFGDCVIQEHWKGKRSLEGSSYNIYNSATKKWHQTWVDSHGTLLELDGVYRDSKMVLVGASPSEEDPAKSVLQRISWEKRDDGRVRQLWETSSDGGQTWTVAFDGWYSRASEAPKAGGRSGTPRR